jgi:hypothetical protein
MTATLADVLRDLTDDGMVALLRLRPDLVVPAPADLSVLAARAASRSSVLRALDRLDTFHLEILDALRLTRDPDGRTSLDDVLAIAAAPASGADRVRAAVRRLRAYLLVYGPEEELRVVATVDEVTGPYPAGLGRPAAELAPDSAVLVSDAARLRRTVLSAPPTARAVMQRLATEGAVGTARTTDPDDPDSPVGWLLSHGLLVATGPTSVELPREVGWLLRRETGPLGALHPEPPTPTSPPVDPTAADAAGAGQAMEMIRHTEAMLEALAAEPAPLLRTGGLGVRDLRRLARASGVTEPVAALLFETAYAAGLIGEAEAGGRPEPGRAGGTLLPAAGYDAWRSAPLADRWHVLAAAWLAMTRAPGLVGGRDDRGRLRQALTPEVEQASAPGVRRAVLGALASLDPGAAPSTGEILALLAWRAPRRAAEREPVARHAIAEAAHLGITGRAALTSYGAVLLAEAGTGPEEDPLGVRAHDSPANRGKAAAILDGLLPEPVADLVVQADLTVVVPGPPDPALAAELDLVAEPVSGGGASVHRLTRDSLRSALDAGYTGEDLHGLFQRRSRTAVPQALTYLIDDVARTHGGLRVGAAGAYLRSDDEALVTQVLADRRLASLGLRRLAPTVLVSVTSSGRLLARLRGAGYSPVPEDGSGAALLVRARSRRAAARAPVTRPSDPFSANRLGTPRLLGIIEDMRRRDARQLTRRATGPGGGGDRHTRTQTHTEALAVLQQAVRDRAMVWVGYVDARGTTIHRLLRPVSMGAGYLRAEDERTDTLHTFALHRITGATREG